MKSEPTSIWTRDSSDLLKQFLEGGVGAEFLSHLASFRPAPEISNDIHAVALQARKIEGFELAFNSILRLAEPPDEETGQNLDAYPDPDDDSKWPDQPEQKEP